MARPCFAHPLTTFIEPPRPPKSFSGRSHAHDALSLAGSRSAERQARAEQLARWGHVPEVSGIGPWRSQLSIWDLPEARIVTGRWGALPWPEYLERLGASLPYPTTTRRMVDGDGLYLALFQVRADGLHGVGRDPVTGGLPAGVVPRPLPARASPWPAIHRGRLGPRPRATPGGLAELHPRDGRGLRLLMGDARVHP